MILGLAKKKFFTHVFVSSLVFYDTNYAAPSPQCDLGLNYCILVYWVTKMSPKNLLNHINKDAQTRHIKKNMFSLKSMKNILEKR